MNTAPKPPLPDSLHLGFAASYARLVVDHVHARDLDARPVLSALGLGLADGEGDTSADTVGAARWVPATRLAKALAVAAELCRDSDTALHIAQQVRPANMGALGYTIISCAQFESGLALFERLQSLICTQVRAVHVLQGERIRSRLEPVGEVPRDTALWIFTLATRLAFARWVSGRHLVLDAVWLPCPAPTDTSSLQGYFGCPLHFDADHAGELAPSAWLNLPNPHADPQMHRLMRAVTDQQWAQQGQDGSHLLASLRHHIAARLQTGQVPLMEDVVPELEAELGISGRQLQRRLADAHQSFKDVVERVRRDQVLHELRHTTLPLADIAHRAAYAEASSMHRAVRRWTGQTPMAVRQGDRDPTPS